MLITKSFLQTIDFIKKEKSYSWYVSLTVGVASTIILYGILLVFSRQSNQWRHIDDQFWRKQQQIRLCRVMWRFDRKIRQQYRTFDNHWRNCADARRYKHSAQRVFYSLSALHLYPWDIPNEARRCRDHPEKNHTIQWNNTASPEPAILDKTTPSRYPGSPGLPSATYLYICKHRHPPFELVRHQGSLPCGLRGRDLCCLSGLVAPKFGHTHGWRNPRGW